MGIAALAFASCAKDTVTETNNGQAIDFRVATTRATEVTTNTLENFYVTAISATVSGETVTEGNNYFENAEFTKSGSYFGSTPAYYWPNDGILNFVAYAPKADELGGTLSISKDGKTLTGFAPADDIADQVDFIVATASGSKADQNSGVALTFDHMLSQIEIKAKNTHAGYKYKVAGVRIAGVLGQADFDFDSKEWDFTNYSTVKKTYEVELANPVTLDGTGVNVMDQGTLMVDEDGDDEAETEVKYSDNAMLLPQNLSATGMTAKFGVYVKVTSVSTGAQVFPDTDGDDDGTAIDEYGWMDVAVTTNWEAGYKYVYTLDMSQADELGAPIKFTLDKVTPMGEGETE